MKNFILLIASILFCISVNAQQLAFPKAVGAGAYTLGGYGGAVIHVTTLDWDAPGGLKEAIKTTGPRIIVFDVSGEIDATQEGNYSILMQGSNFDNMTIAGQYAPAGGITILTNEFMPFDVDQVIYRYIRFRNNGGTQDAFWHQGGQNIIVDHCTFSHGGDESGSIAGSTVATGNVTMQNNFFQDSKTGTILGSDGFGGEFTLINNVYTGISHRFCNTKGSGRFDIINNVVYNWKYRLSRFSESVILPLVVSLLVKAIVEVPTEIGVINPF